MKACKILCRRATASLIKRNAGDFLWCHYNSNPVAFRFISDRIHNTNGPYDSYFRRERVKASVTLGLDFYLVLNWILKLK